MGDVADLASGGVDANEGQLWIAGHFEKPTGWRAVLYRIPLVDRSPADIEPLPTIDHPR